MGIKCCPAYVRLGGAMVKNQSPDAAVGKEIIYGYGYNQTGFAFQKGEELGLGGVNLTLAVIIPAPGDARLVKESDVACPSDMIAVGTFLCTLTLARIFGHRDPPARLLADSRGTDGGTRPVFSGQRQVMRRRHDNQWNMVFCDAHVQAFGTKPLYNYRSPDVLRRWNRDHLPHQENAAGLP